MSGQAQAVGVVNLPAIAARQRRPWNKRLLVGVAIILLVAGVAVGAPWIAPYSPEYQELTIRLKGPTGAHLLGTDNYGRDLLSRVIWGSRVSLAVGLLSMSIAVSVGVFIGATSGYFGGAVDAVLMRLTELMLVFPAFFLLILIVATFGRSVTMLVFMLGFTSWAVSARIIRGEVLKVKERDYILATYSIGASSSRIILLHVLPNIVSVIIVSATVRVGVLILVEAGLSFLGLGIQEPMSSWGSMISAGALYMRQAWWFATFPGVAIFMTVLGFNLLGEGLRDILDPRQGTGRVV
jgi:peptide/nickel transport system permease protein